MLSILFITFFLAWKFITKFINVVDQIHRISSLSFSLSLFSVSTAPAVLRLDALPGGPKGGRFARLMLSLLSSSCLCLVSFPLMSSPCVSVDGVLSTGFQTLGFRTTPIRVVPRFDLKKKEASLDTIRSFRSSLFCWAR